MTTGMAASRRAQSMSGLTLNVNPNLLQEQDPEFRDFEMECAQFEAHRVGLLGKDIWEEKGYKELASPVGPRYPSPRTRTQPLHPSRSRRTASAPYVLSVQPSLLDWDDATIADEFIVPSIQQKAMLEVVQRNVESWDDDFEEEVEIGGYLASIQASLKMDMKHLRHFDLHIKGTKLPILDLKLMFLDAEDLAFGVEAHSDASSLIETHGELCKKIRVILSLAEFQDGAIDKLLKDDVEVLSKILAVETEGKFEFGAEWMPTLVEQIGPIKLELQEYVSSLRSLAMQI